MSLHCYAPKPLFDTNQSSLQLVLWSKSPYPSFVQLFASFGCRCFYVLCLHYCTNPALYPLAATETSDTEITTTEIIKRRDVGPHGIRSEYCIRKIICPLGVPETPKGWFTFHFWCLNPKKGFLFWTNIINRSVCPPSQKPTRLRGKGCAPVPCALKSRSLRSRQVQWWSRRGCQRRSWISGRSEPSLKGQMVRKVNPTSSVWNVLRPNKCHCAAKLTC